MKVLTLLILGLFAFAIGNAQASTTVRGAAIYQAWVDDAVVPTPRGTLYVRNRECGFVKQPVAACQSGRTIYSVSRGGASLFYHELGHAFDELEMTRTDRRAYASLYGQTLPWRTGPGYPLSERFAEDYATCAQGRATCRADVRALIVRAWRELPRKPKSKCRNGIAQRRGGRS